MVHMYIPIFHIYCGTNMNIPLQENPASLTAHGSWSYFPEGWYIAFCSVLTAGLSCVPVLHTTQNLLWTQNDFFYLNLSCSTALFIIQVLQEHYLLFLRPLSDMKASFIGGVEVHKK